MWGRLVQVGKDFSCDCFSWLIFILRVVHKHFFTCFQFFTDDVNTIDGSFY